MIVELPKAKPFLDIATHLLAVDVREDDFRTRAMQSPHHRFELKDAGGGFLRREEPVLGRILDGQGKGSGTPVGGERTVVTDMEQVRRGLGHPRNESGIGQMVGGIVDDIGGRQAGAATINR